MATLLTEFCFPCEVRALGEEIALDFAYEVKKKKRRVERLQPSVYILVSASKLCVGFLQYPVGEFFTKRCEECVGLIKTGSVTEFYTAGISLSLYPLYLADLREIQCINISADSVG